MSDSIKNQIFSVIDKNTDAYIKRLSEAVKIPSISADHLFRKECFNMAQWIYDQFSALGADMEIRENPVTETVQGEKVDLPPFVIGNYGSDSAKKTILIYCHYDVQPANKSDGWDSEPFEMHLDKENDLMRARGITDDKGPLVAWINMLEAYKIAKRELPVNLKFCFEGMEESGSVGLSEFIKNEKDKFFAGISAVTIVDTYWLGIKKPVLIYGLRGVSYYQVVMEGPSSDLHSGQYGGYVQEPMVDLSCILASLVTSNGKILIPGIMEQVQELTPTEEKIYKNIDITNEDIEDVIQSDTLIYDDIKQNLMHRMRYPSLSIHGIEGAFYGPGAKTVIPAKVTGKFSIRTVPNMDIEKTYKAVEEHIYKVFKSLNSKNKCKVEEIHSGPWFLGNIEHPHFTAAIEATKEVFNMEPDLIREGGSIPVVFDFYEELKKNVLLLPMGRGDDGAHSTNEKLNIYNYIMGTKLYVAYIENASRVEF